MTSATPRLLNPHEIGALVELVDRNRLVEAEQQCRSWLRIFPEAGMLWKILGVALVRQGKDALFALRRAAELMPLDPETHGNLGSALHDLGRWGEAIDSLNRALDLEPENLDVLLQAADSLQELGRAGEAVPLYHRALRLSPRHSRALNNLGNAFLTLGQYADAAGHYRLALEIKPDAQILCNLANAQRLLGYLDDALATIRRALSLDPTSSIAHSHLGLILAATGDQEAAIASYRQALILNPNQVDALNNLGVALRDLGFRRDAVALHARAIQCEPRRAESHYDLGLALFEMRRIDDAIAGYREALALKPDHAPAHLNLGIAMRQRRQPAAAEASCRAALAIDPQYVDALAFLGELHADRGQFAEAERLFRQAIALNPDYAPAYASIATHRKMSVDDADWVRGAEALLAKRPSPRDEISLRYALGKYCDDVKSYDHAFEHFARANALRKRPGAPFDGAKLTGHVDQIMRSFESSSAARQRLDAPEVSPIFIVGMPRSGTSLAEQILASHPDVFGAGEVSFWDTAYRNFRQAERDGQVDHTLLSRMAKNYLDHLASVAPSDRRVVDKLPANFLYAGLIHTVFPQARILHMRRHPIDTCLSIYFQNFFNIGPYANDLTHLAHYYREYRRITEYWRDALPPGTWLEIPYEGLLDDLESWTRRMLDFVGLPWDPRCLEFDRTERVVITASKWQVRQKITKTSAGRWRHYERFIGPLRGLIDADDAPR